MKTEIIEPAKIKKELKFPLLARMKTKEQYDTVYLFTDKCTAIVVHEDPGNIKAKIGKLYDTFDVTCSSGWDILPIGFEVKLVQD
jgi:hypothetical protein